MIRRVLQILEYAFAAMGLLAIGYCATLYFRAGMFQSIKSGEFARALRENISGANRAEAIRIADEQPPRDGAVVAQLAIPRLALSTMVVEGDGANDLKLAPGHIPGTALPGKHGNVGIAAHRDTFFRPLRLIRKGDVIRITTLHGAYQYRVVSTDIVNPDDTRLLRPTRFDALTLVTCYPFYYVGPAPKRFILRAQPLAQKN
jgi:sortase A